MKTRGLILLVAFVVIILFNVSAHEKYAILISGDRPDHLWVDENVCDVPSAPLPDEWKIWKGSWNDTYLMWEMLVYEKGYDNDNVFVLWADGTDWSITQQIPPVAGRYDPQVSHHPDFPDPGDQITDYSATYQNVQTVFQNLANVATDDDFLFVWIYGRNGGDCEPDRTFELYNGDYILDNDLKGLIDLVPAYRKYVWADTWFSGCLIDEFNYEGDMEQGTVVFCSENYYGDAQLLANDFCEYGNSNVLENEIIDGLPYYHGEMDFFAYSNSVGHDPNFSLDYGIGYSWNIHWPDCDFFPWNNPDNIYSIGEIEQCTHVLQLDGPFIVLNGLNMGYFFHSSFEYPQLIDGNAPNDPGQYYIKGLIGISKDLPIYHDQFITIESNAIVHLINDADISVLQGATLTIENNVTFAEMRDIVVEQGATLTIGDNVTFIVKEGIHNIIVNGNISLGSNVNFIAEGTAQIWLVINNSALNLSINSPVFENGVIIAYNNQLTVTNPAFTSSGIYGFNGSFDITGGQFEDSFVDFANASGNANLININGATFSGSGNTAIDIDNYPNFRIFNCTITGHSEAVNLYNCGYGKGFQQISNCNIYDNSLTGIMLYRSSADILHNHIINSGFGIKCFDRSLVHIEGDHRNVTQIIKDNKWNEIYASNGSFPQYLHWNLIQDDFNEPNDPMVKYTGTYAYFDVRNNCWGNTFDPLFDLEPSNYYNWNPVWNCNVGAGSGSSSGAEELYLEARENIELEEFAEAKETLEQIIEEYPETEFAKAAMKELYSIEEHLSNSYIHLKEYFNLNSVIQGDSSLVKLADFLSNFCDIKLENWSTAIAWFEDVIQAPESFEDSIFAIIDLGYTYWLMENSGLKSTYTGSMPQYKFASQKDYEENRDYLLSLLPGDGLSETMKQSLSILKTGELLQNVPNPFNGTTQIWFKLAEESSVSLTIYDYTGKEISVINPGTLKTGNHSVEFNSANLPSGIYFYSLEVNGIKTDTKKMTLVR